LFLKFSICYTLLVIVIIAAIPIFIALFTDYEVNKWVKALSYAIITIMNLVTSFPKKEEERGEA
jgi:hypothetical protein